jgi:hypothetical protein
MIGILIGGLVTFLFGGLLLILIFGAQQIEADREAARREARKARLDAARIPRFFVVNQPVAPRPAVVDEAFASHVRAYLEAEQMLADEFVLQPSIESLYRGSATRLTSH